MPRAQIAAKISLFNAAINGIKDTGSLRVPNTGVVAH
jgi:hypothetical protein